MANFSGQINLKGFKGAQVFTGIDAEHPNVPYICIPIPYNDIQVSQDGRYVSARVYMQETKEEYKQACIQRRQQSGDDMTGYMPPSHQMEVSFSREFRERAMEAARKRLLSEHPEWTGADLSDPKVNTDLRNAMYDAVRLRLGSMYYHQTRSDAAPQQPQYAQAGSAQQWTPPQTDPATGIPVTDDDLPF